MSTETCATCGDIEVAYRRSRDGTVVHRACCARLSATSMAWHYAARELGNDHQRVLREISAIPWLRACAYCMGDDA